MRRIAALLIVVAACSVATDTATTDGTTDDTSSPATNAATTTSLTATTSTQATPTTTTLPEGSAPAFGPGIQVVGEDIEPGIYETGSLGEDFFAGCYWERLSGFSGSFDDIIANGNVANHDVVEIADSDVAFSSDCDWHELSESDPPLATIPEGKWVVGVHIQPGVYQAPGGEGCYWERLAGLTGEFDDLIANDLPTGNAIVEIASSDIAFSSSGCGEWTAR